MRLLIILLFVSFYGECQEKKTDSNITSKHIHLPGTKFFIIPPDSTFHLSDKLTGLESEKYQGGINITELPFSFSTAATEFFSDPAANRLFDSSISDGKRKLRIIKSNAENKSLLSDGTPKIFWMQLLAVGNSSVILVASYPAKQDSQLSDNIKNSLLSFIVDSNKIVNPLDALSYSVDVTGTPLQFADIVFQTGVVFTSTGKFISGEPGPLAYEIMVIPGLVDTAEQMNFVKKRVDPSEENNVMEIKPISVAGLDGYELVLKTEDQTPDYRAFLFASDRYYYIGGHSKRSNQSDLLMFRTVTKTFRLKK